MPTPRIAVLYQHAPPPPRNGVRKPVKPGGYADSGADIAFCLRNNGIPLVTPETKPDPQRDHDWVFPDSTAGIATALRWGATVLWLNTVLYAGHPIESFNEAGLECIGQLPTLVNRYDDKLVTNALLAQHGLPVPQSLPLTAGRPLPPEVSRWPYPLMLKPVRGRGSQGVTRVADATELAAQAAALFASGTYGDRIYAEPYLSGQEITVTVLPPGRYTHGADRVEQSDYWALPPVERYNHVAGVVPYSGVVAVVENSSPLPVADRQLLAIQSIVRHCTTAARLIGARAPIRIDCRADTAGQYFIFDLNLKPNMTGAARPNRANQDSLTMIAAREIGWTYFDLLRNISAQRWRLTNDSIGR